MSTERESLSTAARLLVDEAWSAERKARNAAQLWRQENDETTLPDGLAWAWSAATDLRTAAQAAYSASLSVEDALRRTEKPS